MPGPYTWTGQDHCAKPLTFCHRLLGSHTRVSTSKSPPQVFLDHSCQNARPFVGEFLAMGSLICQVFLPELNVFLAVRDGNTPLGNLIQQPNFTPFVWVEQLSCSRENYLLYCHGFSCVWFSWCATTTPTDGSNRDGRTKGTTTTAAPSSPIVKKPSVQTDLPSNKARAELKRLEKLGRARSSTLAGAAFWSA